MSKWKQELKSLIKKDRESRENTEVGIREQLDSFCGKKYFESVVIPAFKEIEKEFKDNGSYVWIHWESNHAWITIGYADTASGEEKYEKEVKYEITVCFRGMKSNLYRLMDFGPQKEWPIDEHELTDSAKGKNIDDITTKDIIDDFIAAYKKCVN